VFTPLETGDAAPLRRTGIAPPDDGAARWSSYPGGAVLQFRQDVGPRVPSSTVRGVSMAPHTPAATVTGSRCRR